MDKMIELIWLIFHAGFWFDYATGHCEMRMTHLYECTWNWYYLYNAIKHLDKFYTIIEWVGFQCKTHIDQG